MTSAQKFGSRIEWKQVDGNGSNALDFHIAFHLGCVLEKSPQIHCTVLSKDKGFDPLLSYLEKNGFNCKRINSQLELDPKFTSVDDPDSKRVCDLVSIVTDWTKQHKPHPVPGSVLVGYTLTGVPSKIVNLLTGTNSTSTSKNMVSPVLPNTVGLVMTLSETGKIQGTGGVGRTRRI